MFSRKNKSDSQLNALGCFPEGICFVRVDHAQNEKPNVTEWQFIDCKEEDQANVLKTISKKYKLAKAQCATYLQAMDYRLLVTEAPPVPDEEMISAIQWDIKEILDIPIEQVTLDIFPVPQQSGQGKNLNVAAAKNSVIADKVEMLKKANINIRIIDIEELALRNIVSTLYQNAMGTVAVLLRKNHGVVIFCKNSELYFSRRIDIGREGLKANPEIIESVALEIQRSIDYFDRHFSNVSIGSVVLMPAEENSDKIVEFLDANLTLPCALADLEEGIHWDIDKKNLGYLNYLLTLGTALRQDEAES